MYVCISKTWTQLASRRFIHFECFEGRRSLRVGRRGHRCDQVYTYEGYDEEWKLMSTFGDPAVEMVVVVSCVLLTMDGCLYSSYLLALEPLRLFWQPGSTQCYRESRSEMTWRIRGWGFQGPGRRRAGHMEAFVGPLVMKWRMKIQEKVMGAINNPSEVVRSSPQFKSQLVCW